MKNISLIFFLLSLSFAAVAQNTETRYYRDRACQEEVLPEKAKYSKTITEEDGITTTTVKNLKKNEVEYSNSKRGEEPMGILVIQTGSGHDELDYNFDVHYEEKKCSNVEPLHETTDFFKNNETIGYTAPTVDFKKPEIMQFIVSTIRYPSYARRNGIQGTVFLAFTITAEGKIQDIVVVKGVHITVDKESVRVLRKLTLASPPLLNGKPQEVCVIMPMKYKLAN
jgi:TonB family protein